MPEITFSSEEKEFLDNLTENERKAFDIAYKAHFHQKDKAHNVYIHHPIKVAMGCTNEKSRIVGLLHDTVEDTYVTLEDLSKVFDDDIVHAVDLVTKPKGELDYVLYLKNIKADPIAREVKLSDLTHNMDLSRLDKVGKRDYSRLNKYQRSYDYLTDKKPFHDLDRFIHAQYRHKDEYEEMLEKIKHGEIHSNWMYFVFPQIRGIGFTPDDLIYNIENIDEVREYLEHPILKDNLEDAAEVLLDLRKKNIYDVLDYNDVQKLRASMTLFHLVSGKEDTVYKKVLDKYFNGKFDPKTVAILTKQS